MHLLFSLLSLTPLLTPALTAPLKRDSCPALHIVLARGTDESTPGALGPLASNITSQLPGTATTSLDYPATFLYWSSEPQGVSSLTATLSDLASSCPTTKLALLGYSQGAQVIMDLLCGSSEILETSSQPLTGAVADMVQSVVVFGDPSRVSGVSYDLGTATGEGIFPRGKVDGCDAFAGRIRSYCNDGDPVCDKGEDLGVHLGIVQAYAGEAGEWVVGKFKE